MMSKTGLKSRNIPSTNRQKPTLSGSIGYIFDDVPMRKRRRTTAIVRHCTKVRQGQFDEAIAYLTGEIAECFEGVRRPLR